MAIVTNADINNLRVSLQHEFQEGYKGAEPGDWMRIATHITDAWGENGFHAWLGLWPSLQEWTGARPYSDLQEFDYKIANKAWANGVKIDRFKFQNDMRTQTRVYAEIARAYGNSARRFPEEQIWKLLPLGLSTLCFDGQNFFDTDHPVYPNVDGTGTAVNTSNLSVPTAVGTYTYWYLIDARMQLKPLVYQEAQAPMFDSMMMSNDTEVFENNDYRFGVSAYGSFGFGLWQLAYCSAQTLNQDNVKDAYEAMRQFDADGNIPLGCKPNLLVVDPSLEFEAREVLKPTVAGGEANTLAGLLTVLAPDYLDKTTITIT